MEAGNGYLIRMDDVTYFCIECTSLGRAEGEIPILSLGIEEINLNKTQRSVFTPLKSMKGEEN